ncbi:MAG: hypothetical protein FWH41_00510 [Treponema sp.]|nr:hypothetical protein [Treponema sp.]
MGFDEYFNGNEEKSNFDDLEFLIGRAKGSYKKAREDFIDQLLSYLGLNEVRSKTVLEYSENKRELESYSKNLHNFTSSENNSLISELNAIALLPPFYDALYFMDRDIYCAKIWFRRQDKEEIQDIMGAVSFFFGKMEKDQSIREFFDEKILLIQVPSYPHFLPELAYLLESEFFISSAIRNDSILVYPRDKYEARIVNFIEQNIGNIVKVGNKINIHLNLSGFNMFRSSNNEKFNLRQIKLVNNIPIPEIYSVFDANGLNLAKDNTSNARFSCEISISRQAQKFATSFAAGLTLLDEKENYVLLSDTIFTPNYLSGNPSIIMSELKKLIINYFIINLPQALANY